MTPEQLRMGRAALKMTTREFAAEVGLSASDCQFRARRRKRDVGCDCEKAGGVVSWPARVLRTAAWCLPRGRVCQRALVLDGAMFKMLDEAGIHPSSSDLIAAGRRAESSNPKLKGAALSRPI